MNKEMVVVAIDGPSASGKSTVSKEVALKLDFVYVDSGSLYRGITWKCIRERVDVRNPEAVLEMIGRVVFDFFVDNRIVRFTMDGEDPGQQIRSEPVRESVSDIAAIPELRLFINDKLRSMMQFGNLVMEGRDIGSVVFPDSPFKFYLDADPEERARRRHAELVKMEGQGDVEEVRNSLMRRDQKDTTRKTAPLQIPLGAKVINSTSLSIEEVTDIIAKDVRAAGY
ncbi:MAG: (d)CMP kinase [Lentisphaerota bacterium]